MKKSICLLAVLSLLGTALAADDAEASKKNPSFLEVRNAALSKEKLSTIKSLRVLYTVKGDNANSFILIRAKRPDQFRFDGVKKGVHFCAIRNGKNFWLHSKKDGTVDMDADEAASFTEYIDMLAVPVNSERVFSDPVFKGEEENNKVMRSRYEVKTTNGSGNVYEMWIENKSKLLRKVEKTDAEGVTYVTLYRDFSDYHGVKLPRHISVSSPKGLFTMKLVKADWNLDIDEKIFDKSAKVIDPEIELLLNSPASDAAKQANAKMKRDKNRIAQLEKKIRKLKLEIAAGEQELKTLETVGKNDRATASSLASITSHSNTSYWNGWGDYGHSRDRAANRDSMTRKKVVAEREKEAKQVSADYKRVSKKLLQQRIELDDAEAELEKLTGEND